MLQKNDQLIVNNLVVGR